MLALGQAVHRNTTAGEELPFPWTRLSAVAKPRRGQMTLLYGPAGSCKSMVALAYAMSLKIPTLYLSPDTDSHDTALRALAVVTGHSMQSIEQGMDAGYDYSSELHSLNDWLRFSFDPSPTIDDLDLEVQAFVEMFGATPELVVVDTLTDVTVGDEDEYRGMRVVMAALHHLTRSSGAAVLVVSHTTGEYDGNTTPAPRRAINGKVSKAPELILSVARQGQHLGVAVVKQRQGFSDPLADSPIYLHIQPEKVYVADPEQVIPIPTQNRWDDEW